MFVSARSISVPRLLLGRALLVLRGFLAEQRVEADEGSGVSWAELAGSRKSRAFLFHVPRRGERSSPMPVDSAVRPLLRAGEFGLHCALGGFYVDPRRAVELAIITHAHRDHLKRGCAEYICSRSSEALLRARVGRNARVRAVEFGVPFELGATRVSLHPAGHILGSSQVRVEGARDVWVVSGDYKRETDPSCETFEAVPCETFITEATFARTDVSWEHRSPVAEILEWWEDCARRDVFAVLYAYALGKAQRILASLHGQTKRRALVHPEIETINLCYRKAGIQLIESEVLPRRPAGRRFGGELAIVPPRFHSPTWLARFGAVETGFASGWMTAPEAARKRGFDRGFCLSDHADWPALLATIHETGARRVLVTHGDTGAMVAHLRESGIEAWPLADYVG
jgi:putative mRNA 3-end processing factor